MASFACISSKAAATTFKLQILGTIWLLLGAAFTSCSNAQLSSSWFYSQSCPYALDIIFDEIQQAIQNETRVGASLTRLHFHDCFVLGCDASVLLDDNSTFTGEKNAFPNINSIRGFEVVDKIKARLETECPGIVSCADILAVAAGASIYVLGGPYYDVQLGRRDSLTASQSKANSDLPPPTLNLTGLITSFANKGLNTQDMVALSGAHTFGRAKCSSFRSRIYNDTNINSAFANSLKSNCPSTGGDNNLANLDAMTPADFDNAYFKNLMNQKGLLHSDQALYGGQSTDTLVSTYSSNTSRFFQDFANAMLKMGRISPLTGTSGQIRTNCRKVK